MLDNGKKWRLKSTQKIPFCQLFSSVSLLIDIVLDHSLYFFALHSAMVNFIYALCCFVPSFMSSRGSILPDYSHAWQLKWDEVCNVFHNAHYVTRRIYITCWLNSFLLMNFGSDYVSQEEWFCQTRWYSGRLVVFFKAEMGKVKEVDGCGIVEMRKVWL